MVYWGTTAVPPPYDEDPLYQSYYAAVEVANTLVESLLRLTSQTTCLALVFISSTSRTVLGTASTSRMRRCWATIHPVSWAPTGANISHTPLSELRARTRKAEIEENRYFIVLMAYDFQLMWKQKKHKLLWEARFSISERHNQFDRALPGIMTEYAARYFGQPTNGLVRQGC